MPRKGVTMSMAMLTHFQDRTLRCGIRCCLRVGAKPTFQWLFIALFFCPSSLANLSDGSGLGWMREWEATA